MRRKVNIYWLMTPQTGTKAFIPQHWLMFIAGSTAVLLVLAIAILLWQPEYSPIAWALLLFSSCHASFLLVQAVGREPRNLSEGMLEAQDCGSESKLT